MKRFDGVSIIVPCYNVEKYLEQCVESLVNQTVDNYEVLLIDDGSTDQTPELCDQFEKKYKDKVKAYHKKNGGLCDARNYGIKKAKAKYLMFVDSDDWVKPNFVELPLKKAEEGFDIVTFDAIEIYDGAKEGYHRGNFDGTDQEKKTFLLYSTNPSFAWARLYDYKLFEHAMYPDPNIWYEDIATTPILLSYAENICHIKEDLYYYRQREGSISHESKNPKILGVLQACERSLTLCNKEFLPEIEYAMYHTIHEFMHFRPEYAEEYLQFLKKYPEIENNSYVQAKIATGAWENLYHKRLIPKKIHYFWYGGNPLNELTLKCIESWKKYAPDYEIIEWNESNCDINVNDYVKEAYEAKKWAFVADYFRIEKLYEEGGIYVDTDVEFTKPIDSLLLDEVFFPIEKNSVNACVFGCVPNHPFIKDWLDSYKDAHFVREDGSYDMDTTIVVRLTRVMKAKLHLKKHRYNTRKVGMGIKLYSPDVLLVDVFNNQNIMLHHYDATWWDVRVGMRSYKYDVMKFYFTHIPKHEEPLSFRIKRGILNSARWTLGHLLPKSWYQKLKRVYRKIKPIE